MENGDIVWFVGRAHELGELEARFEGMDATVEDTWPTGENADIVALVRSTTQAADGAGQAFARSQRFDDEDAARRAAIALAHPS